MIVTVSSSQRCWFETLNDALAADDLVAYWPLGLNISYESTEHVNRNGKHISIYRDEQGRYERPIHYTTKMGDSHPGAYE